MIGLAIKLAKSIAGLFGGKKKKEDETPETDDPEHDAKVTAGLAAIDVEEQKYLENGKLTEEDAEKVATSVKHDHPVFKSITIKDGGATWDYHYVASNGTHTGAEQVVVELKHVEIVFNVLPKLALHKEEYDRQLARQQQKLEAMTLADWLKNRTDFIERREEARTRGVKKPTGRSPQGDISQALAREAIENRLTQEKTAEHIKSGMDKTSAVIKATAEVKEFMSGRSVLHDPDQVAGGSPIVQLPTSSEEAVEMMGLSDVNSHLGSQWRGRVKNLESAVIEVEEKDKEALKTLTWQGKVTLRT